MACIHPPPLAVAAVAAGHGVGWLQEWWLRAAAPPFVDSGTRCVIWGRVARAPESNRWTAIGPRACCRGLST